MGLSLLIVGNNPFLLRLALLPIVLLLVYSLYALARRLAPGAEWPALVLTTLSPAFFPGWNLMQELPLHACILAAFALLVYPQRADLRHALLAGVALGAALLVKYNAPIAGLVIFLYALISRQFVLPLVTLVVGALLFVLGESLAYPFHGTTPFLFTITSSYTAAASYATRLYGLISLSGALLPFAGLFAATSLGVPRVAVQGLLAGVTLSLAAYFAQPAWETILVGLGLGYWIVVGLCLSRLIRQLPPGSTSLPQCFLLAWILGEIVGYLPFTPFPAARRILGLALVGSYLSVHLYSQRLRHLGQGRWPAPLLALHAALALTLSALDAHESNTIEWLAELSAARLKQAFPEQKVYFVGHWEFQYYGERAGMIPLVCDHEPPRDTDDPSSWVPDLDDHGAGFVDRGDLIVVPKGMVDTVLLDTNQPGLLELPEFHEAIENRYRTAAYYTGTAPLLPAPAGSTGHRFEIRVLRAERRMPVASIADPEFWTRELRIHHREANCVKAVTPLRSSLQEGDPKIRQGALEAIGLIAPRLRGRRAEYTAESLLQLRTVESLRVLKSMQEGLGPQEPALEAAWQREQDPRVRELLKEIKDNLNRSSSR